MACKQAVVVAAALLLAGCGGSHAVSFVRVRGPGYSFLAPAGWRVKRSTAAVAAARGRRLVSVTVFPLARRFRPALLPEAQKELAHVAAQLAAQEHGHVAAAHGVPGGGRYVIAFGDEVQELRFELAGRREYQLLCTRRRSDDRAPCAQLFVSFRLA